jgi:hypothetical protein
MFTTTFKTPGGSFIPVTVQAEDHFTAHRKAVFVMWERGYARSCAKWSSFTARAQA